MYKTFSLKNLLIYLFITFGFAWILWGSKILVDNFGMTTPFVYELANFYNFGAWGPLIAAIVVALISNGIGGIKYFVKKNI